MVKSKENEITDINPKHKNLTGVFLKLTVILAVAFSVFELWANSISMLPTIQINVLHLFFLLTLTFLLFPVNGKQKEISFLDIVLLILSVFVTLYFFFNFESLYAARGLVPNTLDYAVSFIAIIIVIEAARRTVGLLLPAIAVFFMIYAYYGQYFPGIFKHRGFTFTRLISRLYLTEEGILGLVLTISSTFVFLFILFGEFLKRSGLGQFFADVSRAITGSSKGGPAKMAVIMSAMMGTISGASVANAATTGAFTINLMKKTGYKSHTAAAVEAAASTGGMIMPPVMGAAAFMIAGFLKIPYSVIMIGAIIPAILYYISVYFVVHSEAIRFNISGLSRKELPSFKKVILSSGHLAIPVVIIVWLMIKGYTPIYAALVGIVSTVAVSYLKKDTRMSFYDILETLKRAPIQLIPLGMACAVIGIIVGVTNMSALGTNIASSILTLSRGNMSLGLLFMLVASLIVSMGLPATAVYAIVAIVAAPAVVKLGVIPLAAHLFVFWFGCLSGVTPPVALCSYTAAGVADASPNRTAVMAFRMALPGFLIPFVFCYRPEILFQNFSWPVFIPSIIFAVLITFSAVISSYGYIGKYKLSLLARIVLFIGAILMIKPAFYNLIAVGLIILVLTYERYNYNKKNVMMN